VYRDWYLERTPGSKIRPVVGPPGADLMGQLLKLRVEGLPGLKARIFNELRAYLDGVELKWPELVKSDNVWTLIWSSSQNSASGHHLSNRARALDWVDIERQLLGTLDDVCMRCRQWSRCLGSPLFLRRWSEDSLKQWLRYCRVFWTIGSEGQQFVSRDQHCIYGPQPML
jgi:hypothetical protein